MGRRKQKSLSQLNPSISIWIRLLLSNWIAFRDPSEKSIYTCRKRESFLFLRLHIFFKCSLCLYPSIYLHTDLQRAKKNSCSVFLSLEPISFDANEMWLALIHRIHRSQWWRWCWFRIVHITRIWVEWVSDEWMFICGACMFCRRTDATNRNFHHSWSLFLSLWYSACSSYNVVYKQCMATSLICMQ